MASCDYDGLNWLVVVHISINLWGPMETNELFLDKEGRELDTECSNIPPHRRDHQQTSVMAQTPEIPSLFQQR